MRVRTKICGICRPEDMGAAIEAGADYVGLVFATSPRQIDPDELSEWLEDARADTEVVGVFRDQEPSFVDECIARFDLDFVQLHGNETSKGFSALAVRLIEASIVTPAGVPELRFPGRAWARLLDAGSGGGESFDWDLAVATAKGERVFLAGGLTTATVVQAIRRVSPFAVDVSSGVELEDTPRRKDPARMREFVAAVRQAGAE